MTPWEKIKMFKKTLLAFVTKIKRKENIKIKYYLKIEINDRDCSYIGYLTRKGGFHGIHYCHQTGNFSFGTRDRRHGLNPEFLDNPKAEYIPKQIREEMKKVAKTKVTKIIKKSPEGWTDAF
jgi:hypothetical protein